MGEMDIRVVKTIEGIRESFLCYPKEIGALHKTVKNITEKARINRSTFYKYYKDKYDLRDAYVDEIIADFIAHLDIAFLHMSRITMESYYVDLRRCLKYFREKQSEYLTLWSCNLQERNVFEEMLDGGVAKLRREIGRASCRERV